MRRLPIPAEAHVTLTIDSHYDHDPLLVENQTFYCMGPNQTAITVQWPDYESVAQTGAIFRNLCFKPGTHEWQNLITLVNCPHGVLDTINGYAGPTGNFHNGITLEGKCLNTMMSRLTFTHCITGVQVRGESEGTKITQSEILASYFGIYNDTPVGEAGEWVTDTHISCARAGIVSRQRPQAFYSNLLIYRHHWRATDAFDGILILEGSHDTNLHDIMVKKFDQPGAAVYVHPGVTHVTQTNIHTIAGAVRQG